MYQLSTDYKTLAEEAEDEEEDPFTAVTMDTALGELDHPKYPYATELRRGHFICLTTFADQAYRDILGQHPGSTSFISYIDSENILANYSNRWLIFSELGHYKGEVKFHTEAAMNIEKLKLKVLSDNMKYYIFEGTEKKTNIVECHPEYEDGRVLTHKEASNFHKEAKEHHKKHKKKHDNQEKKVKNKDNKDKKGKKGEKKEKKK